MNKTHLQPPPNRDVARVSLADRRGSALDTSALPMPVPMVRNPSGLRSGPGATPARADAPLLWFRTAYKPMWLFGLGSSGNALYGTGTVALARGLWPVRPVAVPAAATRNMPAIYQPAFGNKAASLGWGTASSAVGFVLAAGACGLFYADARRLSRKLQPAAPAYRRPTTYFAVHMSAIVVSIAYKFMVEAVHDAVPRDLTWVAAVPGLAGQAAFAVTQAQSFSSCELLYGKMPFRHRSYAGLAARAGVGAFSLLGAMSEVPYTTPYGRECVRLFGQAATTLAFSLPLTTARTQRKATTPVGAHDPKPSWAALWIMGALAAGRYGLGFGAGMVQHTLAEPGQAYSSGHLLGGAAMLVSGMAASVVALCLMHSDVAAYSPKKAHTLLTLAITGIALQAIERGMTDYAQDYASPSTAWLSALPGAVGLGLSMACVPEMFSYAELRRGYLPLGHRYQWTEGCRAVGSLGFGVWAAMLSVPQFNIYAREATLTTATTAAMLGMAFPSTTSRQVSARYDWPLTPAATPLAEAEGFELSPSSQRP